MEHCDVWQQDGVSWGCYFPKQLRQFGADNEVEVRVQVRWTEVVRLCRAPSVWQDKDVRIQCQWKLTGCTTVHPDSELWWLCSDTFGCGGVLWRMSVVNWRNTDHAAILPHTWYSTQLYHFRPSYNNPHLYFIVFTKLK